MNRAKQPSLFLILSVILFVTHQACVDHDFPSYTCPDAEVSYQLDVDPIVQTKCAIPDCHNGSLGADLKWSDFSIFQENAQHGNVKNYVVNRIMPKAESTAGPLTQEQINIIACWVDAGAKDN